MRNPIGAIAITTLCLCVPVGVALAAPIAAATVHSVMHLTSHSDRVHDQSDRRMSPQQSPLDTAPQTRDEGPIHRHLRYFDWHGSRTNTWLYPRSFRYQQYMH